MYRHTIGKRMPDGTVYAGISPDTGKAMYATRFLLPRRPTVVGFG
jgi:hypothetical protein